MGAARASADYAGETPALPAPDGVRRPDSRFRGNDGGDGYAFFVRIRIFRIIGFSGFYSLVFDWQTLARIRLGGFYFMAKTASWANRNPVNPANPENPDSDKNRAGGEPRHHPEIKYKSRATNPFPLHAGS